MNKQVNMLSTKMSMKEMQMITDSKNRNLGIGHICGLSTLEESTGPIIKARLYLYVEK